jgi:N-acyl-D-amino-acid deacylase
MLEIIIRNGFVVDGTGNPWFKADIGIEGEKIVAIGDLSDIGANKDIDAKGLIVAPGFIELHSHSDYLLLAEPLAELKLMQGITTDVSGNCGLSAAPLGEKWIVFPPSSKRREAFKVVSLERAKQIAKEWGITLDWFSFGEYLEKLEKNGIAINHCSLIGQLTLRATVTGEVKQKQVKDEELEEMKTLLAQGMKEGAFGFSTEHGAHVGVKFEEYEILELCKTAAKYGGVFADDLGIYGATFLQDLKKAINTCEIAKIPTVISHLLVMGKENWGKVETALGLIEEARNIGIQIACDVMPTVSTSTYTRDMYTLLPKWVLKGGIKKLIERLKDPTIRIKVKDEMKRGITNKWFRMRKMYPLTTDPFWAETIKVVYCGKNKIYEGKTIAEISRMMAVDHYDTILNLISEEEGQVRMFQQWISDEELCKIMKHPAVIGSGSDGTVGARKLKDPWKYQDLHYAAIPRLLGRYARDMKVLPLEEAIRKLTSAPASFLGLKDRGLLKEGMYADIVIFDFNKIADKTTPQKIPRKPTEGIEYVLVNGKVVIESGVHTKILPGRIIRHEAKT